MKTIKEFSLSELEGQVSAWGQQAFRARQIFSWVYSRHTQDFSQMANLPLALRGRLAESFVVSALEVRESRQSRDGTRKFLFAVPGRAHIEAVAIPAAKRLTGCVSTQAGCKFACAFCASGQAGFKRNLTAGEVLDEITFLDACIPGRNLTHVVFMGTGEPFDNYDNVIKAARIINAGYSLAIGARRITISTCGIIPGIERLAREKMQIELSVSLHAADDATRSRIMPVNKLYPLAALISACRRYVQATNRQVTFEYVMLKGINSDLQNAGKLSTMISGLNCKVNLIPYNSVHAEKFQAPSAHDVAAFKAFLTKCRIPVTIRKERGQDIEAACGQLRIQYEKQ